MTTQEHVNLLMNTMAKHHCSLLEAEIRVNREFTDKNDTAATMIREAFERTGSLTLQTKVMA